MRIVELTVTKQDYLTIRDYGYVLSDSLQIDWGYLGDIWHVHSEDADYAHQPFLCQVVTGRGHEPGNSTGIAPGYRLYLLKKVAD